MSNSSAGSKDSKPPRNLLHSPRNLLHSPRNLLHSPRNLLQPSRNLLQPPRNLLQPSPPIKPVRPSLVKNRGKLHPPQTVAPRLRPGLFAKISGRDRLLALKSMVPNKLHLCIPFLRDLFKGIIDEKYMEENSFTELVGGEKRVQAQIEFIRKVVLYCSDDLAKSDQRMVLQVEDLQWVDSPSIKCLLQVVAESKSLAVIVTAREMREDIGPLKFDELSSMTHFKIHNLSNLTHDQVRKCMCGWIDAVDVPDRAVAALYEKSQGNPLFSKELCSLMVETGALKVSSNNGRCEIAIETDDGQSNFGLPDSINALMTSNLDRLPRTAQLTIKVASVFGLRFQKHELVGIMNEETDSDEKERKLSERSPSKSKLRGDSVIAEEDMSKDKPEVQSMFLQFHAMAGMRDAINQDIAHLVQVGYLEEEEFSGNKYYKFCHVMLKEAAYGLIPYRDRQRLHGHVARLYGKLVV